MILTLTIENWMSYRNPVEFSMIASRERQHGERVSKVAKYSTRILPIAAIYGGNASGKTNFFKALNFIQKFVVRGSLPDHMIPVEPYRLDDSYKSKPSRFKLELLINESIYEFSFAVTTKAVLEEKLVKINRASEQVLYDRHGDKPNFDSSFMEDLFLGFAFQSTRDNQLFLTNLASQKKSVSPNVETFREVYNWFKNNLMLIAPDSRFEPFEYFLDEKNPLYETLNEILPLLGTGISHIGGKEIPVESLMPGELPSGVMDKLNEGIKDGVAALVDAGANNRFVITRQDGKLIAKKLITSHLKSDGKEEIFDIRQESDGSQRLIDLLPAFLQVSEINSSMVYVIDELDRSLHSLLTKELIEAYLASCNETSRKQLLFTTHDILLMDQDLLRRDEMWVAERNDEGSSQLFSFGDYKDVRYDKDIRKSYLQGRLGGIPKILLHRAFCGRREDD